MVQMIALKRSKFTVCLRKCQIFFCSPLRAGARVGVGKQLVTKTWPTASYYVPNIFSYDLPKPVSQHEKHVLSREAFS